MNTIQSQTRFSLNWGHGILGVILLFIACMSGMIYVASKQTNEMVDDHYYQKELAFQGVIDAGNNLQKLTSQSMIKQESNSIIVQFPVGSFENFESGKIEMLRNDGSQHDKIFEIKTVHVPVYEISKNELLPGLYKMRISWKSNPTSFYYEENVFVSK